MVDAPGRVQWVVGDAAAEDRWVLAQWSQALRAAGWRETGPQEQSPADAVLVWSRGPLPAAADAMVRGAVASGRPLLLLGPTVGVELASLDDALGLVTGTWAPRHPSRISPTAPEGWCDAVDPLRAAVEIETPVLATEKVREAVEVWLTAQLGLTSHPVATWNPETSVGSFSVIPGTPADVLAAARLLHLVLLRATGASSVLQPSPLGVGLLAFGAIGAEHARAVTALPQLDLRLVCDRAESRLDAASRDFPGVRTSTDAQALLDDPTVDVVVVSTPPDTHADWAVRCLEVGKHVVVEKPFALTAEEADRVLDAARRAGRAAVVYQNRRFDPDFRTVLDVVRSGSIGEVFHIETFIGGYGHPCNYWHSDEAVSGGAVYDWGSHIIDQLLALHPQPIDHVTAIEHKRRWHDVTNADHTSLTLRFTDGVEASFVHSDLAAALKPRWYVLGTEGGLSSTWRRTSVTRRSAIGTLDEDVLAVTDAPPQVLRFAPDGSETTLALRPAPPHAFHAELVDELRTGWPMQVRAEQSRRVVAVMEAARASARAGGQPVDVDGES
jgi:predicted dehydrogenase